MGTGKPNVRLYCWFEEKFNLSSHQLAYIADNPAKDFVGANKQGWRTIRVLTGEYAATKAAPPFSADTEIAHINEIQSFLLKDVVL